MIAATHAFPVLRVKDLDDGIEFYTKRLGFVLNWRSSDGICVIGNGTVSLFLETNKTIGPSSLVLNVENADTVSRDWVEAGVEILVPIKTQPWGMRQFTARDLSGNTLIVGHVDESEADYTDFSGPEVDS